MGIKYFKLYKGTNWAPREVSVKEAMQSLEGYYKDDALVDIFVNKREFRLFTPYSEVWTNNDGKVPMAGFYGICE